MDEFDYVIVGGGSAGCVLADRLSADPHNRVLLLEAGGEDRSFWIHMPIGYGKTFFDASVNWKYNSEPEPALGDRPIYFPRGKVLGGSSSINAMVYSHGMPVDYDDWRDVGNPGWGWDEVSTVYERFERRVADTGVKGEGPLWVCNRDADYHPVKSHFLDAASELGLRHAPDVNGPEPEGVGGYHVTTRRGWRCSSAVAFLRPARRRPNLEVRSGAYVQKVRFEGRRAAGVDYTFRGETVAVRAHGEVLLAAGAIGSPMLLQRSGVGPGRSLSAMGIDVVHGADAVGGAMQDHLGVNYFYRAVKPTLNNVLGSWTGLIAAGIRFVLNQTGPLSIGVNQFGGMVRSDPDLPRPDTQLYFNPVSYSTDLVNKRELFKPDPWPGFIIGFNSCRPTSQGRVDLSSPDPDAAPRIRPNYLDTNKDIEEVVAGARLIGRLQETEAMRALIAVEPPFDPTDATDDEIVSDFRARSASVYHPCGTCRMAPQEDGGVVDPQLRVYGVEGLRVVDASIFPNITSANTNAPAMMVAYKAADQILAN
ncbi:MAG: GMC family oxidoreductase N-terminal domain-containing protein [Pseudomonadota bacterium]